MNIFLIIQILSFVLYIGYIIKNWGILPSISDSYYLLPDNRKFYFTFFCWGVGFPLIILNNVWFLLASIGLIFLGVASDYKICENKVQNNKILWWIHHVGAVFGILFSLLGIWVHYDKPYYLFVFLILTLGIIKLKLNNKIWWVEIAAFILILSGLLFK